MGDTTQYVQFWFITISVANLAIVALMVLVFALAVRLRLPGAQHVPIIDLQSAQDADGAGGAGLEEQP